MGDDRTAAEGMGVGAARLIELFMDNVLVDAIVSTRLFMDLNSTWGTKNTNDALIGRREERQEATCRSRKNMQRRVESEHGSATRERSEW